MTDQSAREPSSRVQSQVLETDVPLSQSVIWRLQQDFYARRGLKAWTEDMVPSYITNNPFIAEMYAEIVAGFLADCREQSQKISRPLSPENPLRILELGAGTGKFSCLFLRKLSALLRDQKIPQQPVRYCMSDCSESLIAEWRTNVYLAEFVKAGMLEFKLVRVEEESSEGSLSPVENNGPLVVIANYVFDSLPQDAFVIDGGQISEALVTTTTTESESAGPQPLNGLQRTFHNVIVAPDRYAEKSWNAILEHYRSSLSAATVLFPSTALNLLQQLAKSSDGRMLVLAADKGFTREDELIFSQGPPSLEFHAGGYCFSQQVNFDALARYFWSMGGEALLPQKHFSSLSICAFLQRHADEEFPATRKAYKQATAGFGPDDLFALMSWLNAHLEEISIVQALALLRLAHWDTTVFLRLFPVIARQLRGVTAERHDFQQAVFNVWANRYPIAPGETALAFNCGAILLELRFFADALAMFKTSQQVLGQSASTSFNLGLCALGLDHPAEALGYMIEACNLDPSFEPARSSRMKLEKQLASIGTEQRHS